MPSAWNRATVDSSPRRLGGHQLPPCLDHHVGVSRGLNLDETSIAEAIDIGLAVNQSAAKQTRNYVDSLLGSPASAATVGAATPGGNGGRCR